MTDKKTKEEKSSLNKATEWIGFLVAIIAFLSVLSSIIIRYISLGRCLYFDFDLNYYDFSLSNTSKFVFLLSFIAGIISTLLAVFVNESLVIIYKHVKKFKLKLFIYLLLFCVICAIIIGLPIFFIIEKNLSILFSTMVLFFTIIISTIISNFKSNVKKNQIILHTIVAVSTLVVFLAPICMKMEYATAKNQEVFNIITDMIDEQPNYYVVISEGNKNYSSYLCEIQDENGKNIIKIITDKHKYFDINNTETKTVEFDEIQRYETIPQTAKIFLSNTITSQN